MVVGGIGLGVALAAIVGYAPWGNRGGTSAGPPPTNATPPTNI